MKTSYDIIIRPIITEDSMSRVPSKRYTSSIFVTAFLTTTNLVQFRMS